MNAHKTQGFMADPVDDNIYCWNVKMFNFKPDSQIAADLINVKNQYGYVSAIFWYFIPTCLIELCRT